MNVKKKTLSLCLTCVYLFSLSVAPSFALGEGDRNLVLIFMMSLSPVFYLVHARFSRLDLPFFSLAILLIVFPLVVDPGSYRLTTVAYSVMFFFSFMVYVKAFNSSAISEIEYAKIIKVIIYAYTIMLLLQQLCVLLGLPVINSSNYYPPEPWKLNALSAEPAHSARIMSLLMYSLIVVSDGSARGRYTFREIVEKDLLVWLSYLWCIFTMGSVTGLVFFMFVSLTLVRLKNIFPLIFAGVIFGGIFSFFEISSLARFSDFVIAVLSFDLETMFKVDLSAAIRIAPQIIVASSVEVFSVNGLFGNGIDFTSTFLSEKVPGLSDSASGGGMFQIWVEYGFIVFLFFTVLTFKVCVLGNDRFSVLFWFFMVFMYGINSQIVWLTIFVLYTNKSISNRGDRKITQAC